MVGKFIHFNWLYLDEIPTSCRTWGNTTIRVELSAFFYIFLCTKMGAFLFYTCEIKGEKNQQPNSVSLPPSRPLFQSLSVVISLRLFCLCLFFCYFIHKTRISSQYPKGGRLNERGAVAGFVSHCSFL